MTEYFAGLRQTLHRRPDAWARLSGSPEHPDLQGIARFYQTGRGVLAVIEAWGLPQSGEPCGNRFFGLHIHSGGACTGNETDPFAGAMTHYNPGECPHPAHAGDLPPLLADRGHAFLVVLTGALTVREIVGKTVIIHDRPDDFTTQPSGNSGAKIACGVIQAQNRRG